MKKALAVLLLGAAILAGCTAEPVQTAPHVDPVISDDWEYDVPFEEFVAAFPELDVANLDHLSQTVGHNTRAWTLGNGAEGFEAMLKWAGNYATMVEDPDVEGSYRGSAQFETRAIEFGLRGSEDSDAFILYVTSSI